MNLRLCRVTFVRKEKCLLMVGVNSEGENEKTTFFATRIVEKTKM